MAEKEYVLGNKAKDLYQFTRQATKPGPDDKVDAKDAAKVMRTIAKARTIEEMRDMLNAAADRLDNRRKRPFFPKSETFGMIKDLRSGAREEWDYASGWILKADVHHFFASIDHDILKKKLRRRVVDDQVFELMCTYIDSTEGLPLGYQTSQLLALMYLDEFDHWVKETLHAKYYGRYMDDFYIIHEDKAYLQQCLDQIEQKIHGLKLELNGKTAIFPLKNGINFLGFHTYLDDGGGVIMKLRRDSIDRMKARVRSWRKDYPAGAVGRDKIITSWRAWDAHASHGDTYRLREKIAAQVSEIVGMTLTARKPIRKSKTSEAKKLIQKMRRQGKIKPKPPEVPAGFPW